MTGTLGSNKKTNKIKFLYSYGGKIVPRRVDGKLRYLGGHTRVVAVDRSVTFAELMVKFGELCGSSMSLRCKLPTEDLDFLVSVASDEDLSNVIQEYDRVSSSTADKSEMKVRAVLFPIKPLKKEFSLPSIVSSSSSTSSASPSPPCGVPGFYSPPPPQHNRSGCRFSSPAVRFRVGDQKDGGKVQRCYSRCCHCERRSPRRMYVVPPWNHSH
ncbi:unnamed protein product [Ilex paraguariensis]|uniref:PB1 domain-containing protein n=1 Tax=Ilex paraguariensis TaxID=185542 RepID=A0ABC8SLQ1_9AQUA